MVIGSTITYFDDDHISQTFARTLIPRLRDVIGRVIEGQDGRLAVAQ